MAESRFEGRSVVVTGGSSGIGAATVHAFVDEGAHVVAVGRDAGRLEAVRRTAGDPDRVVPRIADVSTPAAARGAIRGAIEAVGRVDVLVNNAGIAHSAPALDIPERQWRETLAVNLDAAFFATQAAARNMIESGGGGSVVSIASTDAFSAEAPQLDYNVSKAALVMMMRSFALELGHLGIRCNCVAPGETATPMVAEELERPDFRASYLRRIPLRRIAEPREIAAAVLFLASDAASFVTGATVLVDGGQLAGDWYDPRDEPPVPVT